uniref:RING-type domain-containing protein n=1 Tax=Ciona intestinalis TaxID=7719 RepID=F6ZM33_CIOIN
MDIRCDGLRVVHNDGRLVPSATNSERELYTRPGDPYYESYRLATFTNYPNQNINVRQVARAGFYFISYQDQVKCFSCGQICEDLQQYDDMSLPQWHLPDCEHLHSLQPNRNNHGVCILGLPRQPTTITINQPRIRSTFTIHEHSNIDLFPCNRPESPHMRSVEQRLQTFTRSNWPAHRVRASILDISRAGLFYLGNSDRTKCWYCNGGLQNWEPNDDPWYEHAKWFPECEFLLQQKGIEYVYRVSSSTTHTTSSTRISAPRSTVVSGPHLSNESVKLEQSRMCKVCHRNQANMVLLPCGHVACCTTCGNDVTNCPVCLADITDRVRSYIG